mmetsp:Transcript_19794/g.35814  ORF Transcript_19794/g.35814 Transcript_19794/m.35814 type:complete len:494 (-) Transcript_19794:76-1557(-)
MALPLILLLLLSFLSLPPTHGFSQPSLLYRGPVVKPPLRVASSLSSTASPLEDNLTTAIVELDNSDNIDDIRRARSVARRDRLSRWLAATAEEEDEVRDRQDVYFLVAAFLPALLAFVSWESISFGLSEFLETYGSMKAVDGNQFANNLLRPTITGVVVPVISIALATLVSTTINVLRQRQVDLRTFVNKEACELRLLRRAVFGMFGTRQHAGRKARALALLCGYTEQLMRECEDGAVDGLKEMQLSGGIADNELDRLSGMLHGVDGASASRQGSVGVADNLILSLVGHRSERVALLLSGFPVIHWGVLIGLSLNLCIAFLLTSNQQVLQYLNSLQLRFLFGTIVGICSSTATLCWDLSDPFSGTFSIEGAGTQLADLRVCLREDVREALAEAGEISSSTRNFFRSTLGGPVVSASKKPSKKSSEDGNDGDINPSSRYGLLSTLYFHLLTGPLGSNVRAIGDVMAWLTTLLGRRVRSIVNWQQWPWQRGGNSA